MKTLFSQKELNKLANSYLQSICDYMGKNLDKQTAQLCADFMDYHCGTGGLEVRDGKLRPAFCRILQEDGITDTAKMMESPRLNKLITYLLGSVNARLFNEYLKQEAQCTYTCGYYRRSQRSANVFLHLDHIDDVLTRFLRFAALGLTTQEIAEGGSTPLLQEAFKDNWQMDRTEWMAAHVAAGTESVINAIRKALTCEDNSHRLQRCHLGAIARSGNCELLELEGKLLLAARLQEGLRQAILETVDEGTAKNHLYMLSIIINNNLLRFASVKRAIAVWTGMGEMNTQNRVFDKIALQMYTFLNDRALARKALQSIDSVELYMGLWCNGFYNTDEIETLVSNIITHGQRHQAQTLFYYLGNIQSPLLTQRLCNLGLEHWHDDLSVMAALLSSYLSKLSYNRYYYQQDVPRWEDHFASPEEARQQYKWLKALSQSMPTEKRFEPFIFPWDYCILTRSHVVDKMILIAWMLNDTALLDDLCDLVPSMLDSYSRDSFLTRVIGHPSTPRQEAFVLQSLADRSIDTRNAALNTLEKMVLTPEQTRTLEEMLRLKYSEVRVGIIKVLMKQTDDSLSVSLQHLLTDKVAERRLAGLDIMQKLQREPRYAAFYAETLPLVQQIVRPSGKEQIMIDALTDKDNTEQRYSKTNGFGLYNPALTFELPAIPPDTNVNIGQVFSFITSGEALKVFEKLNDHISLHKDDEFKDDYGNVCLVGNNVRKGWRNDGSPLNRLGLPELWTAFYEQEICNYSHLLMMCFMLKSRGVPEDNNKEEKEKSNSFYPLFDLMYEGIPYRGLQRSIKNMTYSAQINSIVEALESEYRDDTLYQHISATLLERLLPHLTPENIVCSQQKKNTWLIGEQRYGDGTVYISIHEDDYLQFWLDTPRKPINDTLFTRYFLTRYRLYQLANYMEHTPPLESAEPCIRSMDFVRAWMLGLIPEGEVYREMMGRLTSHARIEGITMVMYNGYRNPRERDEFTDLEGFDFSAFKPVAQRIVDRILEIELHRGDSATEVTDLANSLRRIYGVKVLIRILQAFGKDAFVRDGYGWNRNDSSKRDTLSYLLKNCHPLPQDTPALLKKLAKEAGLKDERLVTAAMFASQWLELVEKAIGWKGLTSTAWYFRAHTSESYDDREKAIIARYTPIDPEQLHEGAFDINWFKEAYKTIGKTRFEVVYDAAKYISSSNGHTRARKFADATNGKFKVADTKKEIIAKRNKDLLMAYSLIPLGRNKDKDLLERYCYLQQFLKESKEFGAQRQTSEKAAVNIALQNLASNSGYGDVTRLTWNMETELIKGLLPYLTPHDVEGVELWVEINGEGKSEIHQRKAGKDLNSIPAKLKKHPYVEELKEVHKQLKDQYTRSRFMLEQAMEDGTTFEEQELHRLMQNPVIWPLLKKLVFTDSNNTRIGFYADSTLFGAESLSSPLASNDLLRIAHPVDLYNSGQWHAFQKVLFDKAIRQPFKQVFRELYVPTEEERETTQSLRYAGNQIQPQKTVAILKKRRWVADYEDGLQKVYYKENVIATIYAMADWFSPADIEAPTLEYVCFYSRKDYRAMKVDEVPPIIFSEVMRDVDLAVSIAHAGGVDPETSHSTIEMRTALLQFTLPLFRLNNVTVKGNFAHITGKLGNYNIHLGSGVIHQEGGAQIAVLPVHSQSRGRLFLPFVDEDPKTAEILTKVLFFAQDDKIKDPSILQQIK